MAATTAACQGIWLAWLLEKMLNKEALQPKLLVDNKSTISLAKNPVFHDRSKDIEIRYHFIRECVEQGRIYIDYVRTSEQLADNSDEGTWTSHLPGAEEEDRDG